MSGVLKVQRLGPERLVSSDTENARRARTLQRVLAGRKRVSVAVWKWGHPQTIDTLQRVPLPERYLKRALLRFSEFVTILDEAGGQR